MSYSIYEAKHSFDIDIELLLFLQLLLKNFSQFYIDLYKRYRMKLNNGKIKYRIFIEFNILEQRENINRTS